MSDPPLALWLLWAGLIVLLIVARGIILVGRRRDWWHCWHYADGKAEGSFSRGSAGCLSPPERYGAYRQRCCRCPMVRVKELLA